jgi:Fe-S-cluster-containing hydrogenase component 2
MHSCPTQAIRVIEGKAKIIEERCIDCGECIKVCPYHAKGALTDTLEELKRFKYNIAVPAISFYGQFPAEYDMNQVLSTFLELGFDAVFDTSYAADIISAHLQATLKNQTTKKPMISTYCPAITRLIQMRYPSLIDNISHLESPMEVSARIAKQRALETTGYSSDEIGVFYISQCPAQITSIKKPLGIEYSEMSGAIALNQIYPKILKAYDKVQSVQPMLIGSGRGIGWGRVGGQSYAVGIEEYLAVDGIEEVMKVLDKLEIGKLHTIDLFEGYACVTGCSGGPLNVENAFVAKSRIRTLAKGRDPISLEPLREAYAQEGLEWHHDIEPLGVMKLDMDFRKAMEKMSKIEELNKILPNIDCGACGSPTCRSLAEDVVMGRAKIEDCVVKFGRKKK